MPSIRRRALAYDLTQLCPYDVMNSYHAELVDHLCQPAPPGYSPISLHQLLRADRQAFMLMSERLTTLKKDASGNTAIEKEISTILNHASVSFHLLPLAKERHRKDLSQSQQIHPENDPGLQVVPNPSRHQRAKDLEKERPAKIKEAGVRVFQNH